MEELTCDNYILAWERDKQWCVFKDATQGGATVALFVDASNKTQAFMLKVSCNSYGHLGLTPVEVTGFVVPEDYRGNGAPIGAFLRNVSIRRIDDIPPTTKDLNKPSFCHCDITLLMREGCKCGGG